VTNPSPGSSAADADVRELYRKLLEAWDKRNARDYAMLFAPDAILVGFDGTQVFGQADIGAHISEVFSHHQTARYVSIVRGVRAVTARWWRSAPSPAWCLRTKPTSIPK
jgi:uncharacterized protein (TIGR02246 family)